MHQYAIAMLGSSSSACVHERSDSVNQNEWICETPCRKKCCAGSDEVVTGKFRVVPIPGRSFAGRSGCAPGGTMHKSASFFGGACLPLAATAEPDVARLTASAATARGFMPASICGRAPAPGPKLRENARDSGRNRMTDAVEVIAQPLLRAAERQLVPRNRGGRELPALEAFVVDAQRSADRGRRVDDDHR